MLCAWILFSYSISSSHFHQLQFFSTRDFSFPTMFTHIFIFIWLCIIYLVAIIYHPISLFCWSTLYTSMCAVNQNFYFLLNNTHTHTKNRTYTEKNNNFNTECAPRARCKQHFRQMNQTTQLYTAEYKRNRNFNTTTRPYYFVFVFVVFMSCFVHVYIYECRYILNVLAFILFALVALLFHAFDPMALSENEFFMPIAVQWIKIARTWQLKIFAWNKMSYTPTSHLNKNKGTTPLSISPPFTYIEYMNCSLSVRFSSVGSHFFVFFILHLLLFLLWNM